MIFKKLRPIAVIGILSILCMFDRVMHAGSLSHIKGLVAHINESAKKIASNGHLKAVEQTIREQGQTIVKGAVHNRALEQENLKLRKCIAHLKHAAVVARKDYGHLRKSQVKRLETTHSLQKKNHDLKLTRERYVETIELFNVYNKGLREENMLLRKTLDGLTKRG